MLINYDNEMQYNAFNVMSDMKVLHDFKYLTSRGEILCPLFLFFGARYLKFYSWSKIEDLAVRQRFRGFLNMDYPINIIVKI